MWQRFTERARRTVFFAQEEAGRLGENYVSTEHLLLGMVRENDSVAARILDRMGVSLGRLRAEVERQLPRGEGHLGQDMQLTPRAKRVIDLAYDEARQLSNNYIGTEHLLLGLIREGEGLAGRVLAKMGAELERARREIMALQDNDSKIPATENKDSVSNQDLKTLFAEEYRKLSLDQQTVLAQEGIVLTALPAAMQVAVMGMVELGGTGTIKVRPDSLIRIETTLSERVSHYRVTALASVELSFVALNPRTDAPGEPPDETTPDKAD